MITKYEELRGALEVDYNLSLFCDNGEESMLLSNGELYITVSIDNDSLYVLVEEYDSKFEEYLIIDTKWYKTVKGAEKFIRKILA